jgi:nucleotide-binding universal stress UspA family protein
MFQRILFPTDGSAASLEAAEFVNRLAGAERQLHVTVAFAISPASAEHSDIRSEAIEPHNVWLRSEAQRVVDQIARKFKSPGLTCTTKILEGNPVSAVLATEAAAGDYDLLVMSSRGLGQQYDNLRYLGSVTEHVIRRVSIPVLVIPVKDEDKD